MATFYLEPGWDILRCLPAMFIGFLLAFPFLWFFAAPGAVLFSHVHALQMERLALRARNLAQIRIVGILLGIPLGIANLAPAYVAGSLLNGKPLNLSAEMMPWLIPAVAGGAGLGWGVTLGLQPGLPEER